MFSVGVDHSVNRELTDQRRSVAAGCLSANYSPVAGRHPSGCTGHPEVVHLRAIVHDPPIGGPFGTRAGLQSVGARRACREPGDTTYRDARTEIPLLGDVAPGQLRDGEWMATKAAARENLPGGKANYCESCGSVLGWPSPTATRVRHSNDQVGLVGSGSRSATTESQIMNDFPPIADYAFVSDCQNSCLIAPDGSVEWLCLPQPDSPSVFGALLDRSAGSFRFGPSNTVVPHQRRYVPGTMVVETTWHNSTGWLIVQDLLVIRRVQGQSRREGYRRAPPDSIAAGVLLRTAKCISGYVDIDATCIPLFDFGRATGQWSYENDSYGHLSVRRPDSEERLSLVSSLRLSIAGARCYGRTNLAEGEEAFVALSWGDSAPTTQEEVEEDVASTVAYWRRWLATGRFPDHPWRPYIERSALTLKGLSYTPTGAVMAASTTLYRKPRAGPAIGTTGSHGSGIPGSSSVRSTGWDSTGKPSSTSPSFSKL